MEMEDCIFCKIANGEIPANMVYEDEVVAAFLDLSQATKGHTLLVPKKHLKDIFEYDSSDVAAIFRRIPIIADAMQAAFPDMKGLNLLNNNGEAAYQSVFHSHIHLIPRYSRDNDDFKITMPTDPTTKYSAEELQAIAAAISKQIER